MNSVQKEKDRSDVGASERSEEILVVNDLSSEGDPSFKSISEFSPSVKDLVRLKEFRERTGLMAKDIVPIIAEDFPKFSKQAFSMCENSDQYGVVLHPAGFAKLQAAYPDAAVMKKKKKSGKNRLKKRISARLSDAEYDALVAKVKSDGFDTMQAFLVFMVRNYLKET